ncbi:hypothetical protein AYJ54_00090 [Bradyrhizobium centrolobii]|uniref:Uncharacterized protein n=2 Tax=Bradyrhizobium TaxID=374 RepID=A0A176YZ88_9BRAD|nr:hypothetical protein AYJ54_00090 [Bradyrhizobium centrolobii]OAF13114.1 hypothetical protein AXW67_18700 [Bradyrhizobium neotropicale]
MHGKLVADLATESPGFGKLEMMGLAWGLLADKAGLFPDDGRWALLYLRGGSLGKASPTFCVSVHSLTAMRKSHVW